MAKFRQIWSHWFVCTFHILILRPWVRIQSTPPTFSDWILCLSLHCEKDESAAYLTKEPRNRAASRLCRYAQKGRTNTFYRTYNEELFSWILLNILIYCLSFVLTLYLSPTWVRFEHTTTLQSIDHCASINLQFFKYGTSLGLFYVYFRSLQRSNTILQQNKAKKYPSSLQHQDSNSWPLDT